jgi:outer membrane lipoprotein SlyB
LAGSAIEEGATRQTGLEITVRLENGQYIAITQAADEEFRPGERVRVLSGRGTTRVTH